MSVNGTCTLVDLVPAARTRDGGRVGGSVCVERRAGDLPDGFSSGQPKLKVNPKQNQAATLR